MTMTGWHNDRGIMRYHGDPADLDAACGLRQDNNLGVGSQSTAQRRRAMKVTTTALRNWAAFNDIDCPPTGQIPHEVLDAFEAAGWAA